MFSKETELLDLSEKKWTWLHQGWPFWCFCFFLLIYLFPVLGDPLPQRDVALRYAPMAEAMQMGEWTYAFHPRTGFLHTFCSGIFACLFSCNGFLACKISSFLFMALGIFPCYSIFRRCFSRSTAELGCVLYILTSQLQHLAFSGLRDAPKCFLILLAAYALITIYQERQSLRGYIWLGIASGTGFITRGDLVAFMAFCVFCGMVMEWRERLAWRSLIVCLLGILCAAPGILLNFKLTGAAVPEFRFALLYERLTHHLPGLSAFIFITVIMIMLGWLASRFVRKLMEWKYFPVLAGFGIVILPVILFVRTLLPKFYFIDRWGTFLFTILDGLFLLWLIPAVIGIIVRIRKREWKTEETILLMLLSGHTFLVIAQIMFFDGYLWVTQRYLIPAVPLEIPWAIYGIVWLWKTLTGYLPVHFQTKARYAGIVLIVIVTGILLYDGIRPVLNELLKSSKIRFRAGVMQMASAVRQDYPGPRIFHAKLNLQQYNPCFNPGMYFVTHSKVKPGEPATRDYGWVTVTAYMSGGRVVDKAEDAKYIVEEMRNGNDSPVSYLLPGKKWSVLTEVTTSKGKYRLWKISPK